MSSARKVLRERVRKHLKKAKKTIPQAQRGAITFSSVYGMLKASSNRSDVRGKTEYAAMADDTEFLPKQENSQVDADESASSEQIINI